MKKLIAAIALLLPAALGAQVTQWQQWPQSWVRWDGGQTFSLGYTTILNDAVAVTQRSKLNIIGGGCVDNAGTLSTDCTFGGTGAPSNAQYWVGAADGTLSAEKNLGALATGLVINTAGVPTAYAGTSCTNQFPRSLSASGAATCASVAIASDVSGLGSNVAAWLATASSANLASALTDETGSGVAVFGTSPTIAAPTITGTTTFSDGYKRTHDPKTEFAFHDDFTSLKSSATSTCADYTAWSMTAGPGTADGAGTCTGEANHFGILTLTTDDNAAGSAIIMRNTAQYMFVNVTGSVFTWLVRVPTLSVNASQEFDVRVGFNSTNATTDGDALTCWYSDNINSGEWECRAVDTGGGAGTNTIDTNVAVVAGTWYEITWVVLSSTSVQVFINGSSVGTHTTHVTQVGVSPIASILKSVGSTPRTFGLDYVDVFVPITR